MAFYSRNDNAVDDFDEYDPTPYGGGYDIALTYGRPLPASDETCYPIRSASASERHNRYSSSEPFTHGDEDEYPKSSYHERTVEYDESAHHEILPHVKHQGLMSRGEGDDVREKNGRDGYEEGNARMGRGYRTAAFGASTDRESVFREGMMPAYETESRNQRSRDDKTDARIYQRGNGENNENANRRDGSDYENSAVRFKEEVPYNYPKNSERSWMHKVDDFEQEDGYGSRGYGKVDGSLSHQRAPENGCHRKKHDNDNSDSDDNSKERRYKEHHANHYGKHKYYDE